MKNKKGFTLIELLIVIAVIAILVAIVIPNFRGIRIQAKQAAAMADLRNLQTACMVYMKFHNVYPTAAAENQKYGLDKLTEESIDKRIVNKIPDDPFREGKSYLYTTNGDGENTTFAIWSVGPDGQTSLTVGVDTVNTNGGDDIYVTDAGTIQ